MLKEYILFVALGLLFQLASMIKPFRKQVKNREKTLDLVACISVYLVNIGFFMLMASPILLVSELPFMQAWYQYTAPLSTGMLLIIHLLLIDLLSYWAHRIMHQQWLWNIHAFHHSQKHIWWLGGMRASPIHVMMMGLPLLITVILFPAQFDSWTSLVILILFLANQHWLHSNVTFPFESKLVYVLVTPQMHFVHHSKKRRFSDSNYGFMFSFWDRLFGTYTDYTKQPKDDVLGLNYSNSTLRLILGIGPKKRLKASFINTDIHTEVKVVEK
ncbi:sterol desaturase family protein [uncultured Shewanella sp.]|uniref:sterol desaturase family protein n=1 Tax=uncultured Shewanella sp. TaxID=173975 RepID=UPI002604C603|nr:sterol desaturase family protein [uncultured Shewanella sp.]